MEPGDDEDRDKARDDARIRRWRNIALALVLGALVILFFVMTVVQFQIHYG